MWILSPPEPAVKAGECRVHLRPRAPDFSAAVPPLAHRHVRQPELTGLGLDLWATVILTSCLLLSCSRQH